MKSKTLSLFGLSILTLVLLMSLVSADLIINNINAPSTVAHDAESFDVTFDLTNDDTVATDIDWTFVDNAGGVAISNVVFDVTDIEASVTVPVTATITFLANQAGNIDVSIKTDPLNGTGASDTKTFVVNVPNSPELSVSDLTISKGSDTGTITVTNTGNVNFTSVNVAPETGGDFTVALTPTTITSLNAGDSQTITVTITSDLNDLDLGSNEVIVTATSGATSDSGIISTEGEYCDYNDLGNLDIDIKDIDVKQGFGDEDEWFPFDTVEVEVKVENNGNEDIDDIEIEWGLFNTKTGEFIIDDTESDFNLKDGDDKTITITFKLDEDIDELETGDFIFVVKATGEDDEFDGNNTCASESASIDMVIENDFVILDDIEFADPIQCGASLQVTADVWNVGDDDQDDVSIRVFIDELGISKTITIGDIDAFEDENLDVSLDIPSDAEEKIYHLRLWVLNEDNDIYENEFDDEESTFDFPLNVEGGCSVEPQVAVSANLESGGQAGQELVVKATITNLGDELASYSVNAAGYTEWADSAGLDQNVVLLNAGDSVDVLITFSVKSDALGDQIFDIEIMSDNEIVAKQPVAVTISEGKGRFGITGAAIFGDNTFLWVIGFLNIALVIIIILVAVRVARK